MSSSSTVELADSQEAGHISAQATALFTEVMANVYAFAEKQNKRVVFPKETLWLGGAPGSGKGTNTNFIMKERHLTAKPIVMSDLLDSAEARAVKAAGGMVGDFEVVQALFKQLIHEKYRSGVVVDGFPRTKVQADVVRLLYDTAMGQFRADPANYPRPLFRIVVLYVEQTESVARQLKRGRLAQEHNKKVQETGEGELEAERDTDFDPSLAKKRYIVFKETTYGALENLGKHFTYNLINAQGDYSIVRDNIKKEMEYQSRLELNPDTHNFIRDLPRASEIIVHARQALVSRLDVYAREHTANFKKAVRVLEEKFYPEVNRHVIAGKCYVTIPFEAVEPDMAIDILTDRGFRVVSERVGGNGPMRYEITWERPTIRRLFL